MFLTYIGHHKKLGWIQSDRAKNLYEGSGKGNWWGKSKDFSIIKKNLYVRVFFFNYQYKYNIVNPCSKINWLFFLKTKLIESFGAGTAVVVGPIGGIGYKNKDYKVNFDTEL